MLEVLAYQLRLHLVSELVNNVLQGIWTPFLYQSVYADGCQQLSLDLIRGFGRFVLATDTNCSLMGEMLCLCNSIN